MQLIFVYNADAGLFNALTDSAHKLLSPDTYACSLCAVTYGLIGMKKPWRDFIESLPHPVRFLHRDEYHAEFPGSRETLPALFSLQDNELRLLLGAETIDAADSLPALIAEVRGAMPQG